MGSHRDTTEKYRKVIIPGAKQGLGIRLIGGFFDDQGNVVGIFVKKIMRGGVLERNGGISVGDEIIEVNGKSVKGFSNSRAVEQLRIAAATDRVEILAYHDAQTLKKFARAVALKKNEHISRNLELEKTKTPKAVPSMPRKLRAMKNHFGIGIKLRKSSFGERESLNALVIDSIMPCGAIATDGRLEEGDVLLKFNGVNVTSWKPVQFDSLLLRDKLDPGSSFEIEYVSHRTAQNIIYKIIEALQQDAGSNSDLPAISACEVPMELTSISPIPKDFCEKTSPQRRKVLTSLSRNRKLTLEQGARIKFQKLQTALEHLGIFDPTPDDMLKLNNRLKKDENDMVIYGDFVEAVKQVFHDQLSSLTMNKTTLSEPETAPIMCDKAISTEESYNQYEDTVKKLQNIERENKKLQQKVENLNDEKSKLHDSLSTYLQLLEKSRQDAATLRKQNEDLSKDINPRDVSSEEPKSSPVTELEPHSSSKDLSEDLDEMRTRASLIDCEYRKAMETQKTQEEVIRHLLHFATMAASTGASISQSNAWEELGRLIEGAQEAVSAVKPLLENEELPYGWEEATLPDGSKYFINHADRTTSWTHPREDGEYDPHTELQPNPIQNSSHSKQLSLNYPLITLSSSDSDTQDDL